MHTILALVVASTLQATAFQAPAFVPVLNAPIAFPNFDAPNPNACRVESVASPLGLDETVVDASIPTPVFASSGGDAALRCCCASGMLAMNVIDDADLSHGSKLVLLSTTFLSGIFGIGVGAIMAFTVLGILDPGFSSFADLSKHEREFIVMAAFGTGAIFTLAATGAGLAVASVAESAFRPTTPPRTHEMERDVQQRREPVPF